MTTELTFELLLKSISQNGAALRSITRLQPVGGQGDRVFPATFSGGTYAIEKRRISPASAATPEAKIEVDCVLLNSNASEANHAELALLEAVRREIIRLPLIEVNFESANETLLKPLQNLTSLEVPHRLADAILRDSNLPDGTRFSKSSYAASWRAANLWNATPVYRLCPTALVFGMWGSPEKPGGLGAKFERAFVSEVMAIDVDPIGILDKAGKTMVPKRPGFRIDPLNANSKVPLRITGNGFEVLSESKKNSPLKASELNHGNILIESANCGVRFQYAEQVTVVSFGALRKLKFPVNGKASPDRDDAGRAVLASIALCAAVFAAERGTSLRSRCHLFPEAERTWELIAAPGATPESFTLSGEQAAQILTAAIDRAEKLGLTWNKEALVLKPTPELVALTRRSQEIAATEVIAPEPTPDAA
ncbi:MAG: CRISPR-associated protein [Candidatus Sulfotelmatobacter sp.]|nr:CRISPR-associated protein [Candidatus Sulfotelmatobacter sp.]